MKNMNLDALAQMEYPGRFIIVGQLVNEKNVVVYGLSGRSPSSQARVFKSEKKVKY